MLISKKPFKPYFIWQWKRKSKIPQKLTGKSKTFGPFLQKKEGLRYNRFYPLIKFCFSRGIICNRSFELLTKKCLSCIPKFSFWYISFLLKCVRVLENDAQFKYEQFEARDYDSLLFEGFPKVVQFPFRRKITAAFPYNTQLPFTKIRSVVKNVSFSNVWYYKRR